MKLIRKILRLLFSEPKKPLSWSVQDFKIAKSYLKRLDNPSNPKKSLWDKVNNPWNDSVDIIHEVNKIIYAKQK